MAPRWSSLALPHVHFPSPLRSFFSRPSLARDPAPVQMEMGDKTSPPLSLPSNPGGSYSRFTQSPFWFLPDTAQQPRFPNDTDPRREIHPLKVLMVFSKPTPVPSYSVFPKRFAFIGLPIYFETGSFSVAQTGLRLSTFYPQPPKCQDYRRVVPF